MAQDKPHDSLFRLAWSDLPTARSHFQDILPSALAAQLDWSTLTLQRTGLRAVEALFRYILSVVPTAPPFEVRQALNQRLGPQTEAHLVSYAEQLREEGRQLERLEGSRKFILQLLKIRFPKADWSDIEGKLLPASADLLSQVHADAALATSPRQFRTLLAQRLNQPAGS
jgi:hypothetical protein